MSLLSHADCKNNTFSALRYYDQQLDTVFSKYYVNGRHLNILIALYSSCNHTYTSHAITDTAPLMDNSEDMIYWKEYYDLTKVSQNLISSSILICVHVQ